MKTVSIRFLGRFELQSPFGSDVRLNGMKSVLLRARLTMPTGQIHDRNRLSGLHGPDRAWEQALASLRQSQWSLRKGLGEGEPSPILVERSSICLNPDIVDVDTAIFAQLVRKGEKADLEQAVEPGQMDTAIAGVAAARKGKASVAVQV